VALIFTQTDNSSGCANGSYCTGRTSGGAATGRLATVGGTPGGAPAGAFFDVAGDAANLAENHMICDIPVGTSGDAGTWTVRVNITTSNMNLTITEIHICRVNSCLNQETIGSATGLSISLGSTGVKTQTVTGAAVTLAAGDDALVSFVLSNGSMTLQQANLTLDQNIDSPFTAVTQSLVYDPCRAMRPHLVRKVREFFLGGLPPKLARLRMKLTDAGLWLPAHDPQLRRRAA
jgi:hypothetical protein